MLKLNLNALEQYVNIRNFVIFPFLFISFYYVLIASERYTSEATFTVMENGAVTNAIDIGLLGLGNTGSVDDEYIIREYLLSPDILEFLDQDIELRAHYRSGEADFVSRLWNNASKEEFLEYYRDHIRVDFDETSGLLIVEVQAYERDYAVKILNAMLRKTELVINDISWQMAKAQSDFLKTQVTMAQEYLKKTKLQLLAFQNEHQVFSPERQGESLTGIIEQLEGLLIEEKTKLSQLLSYQKRDAPQVISSNERIRALSEQMKSEKARLIGDGDNAVNDLMSDFINLQLDLEFAKNAYTSTQAAYEQANAEASKKLKHLIVVSKPSIPEDAKYPDITYILLTSLMVLTMLFGIVRMTITTIREHRD